MSKIRPLSTVFLGGLLLAALTASGCAGALSEIIQAVPGPAPSSEIIQSPVGSLVQQMAPLSPGSLPDVASVVQAVKPGVVSIQTVSLQQNIFGLVPQSGQGSGFLINAQGHVITNAHVVQGADTVSVTLADGRVFPEARVVGRDEVTDLAVVQVVGDNLPVVRLGKSSNLRVGDWVVAIGNALALPGGPTVTAGIVSAVGRDLDTGTDCLLEKLIQTDAAINPGNSGGPLFNLNGEVVGINTAVERDSGGVPVEGIGFAISIDQAVLIIEKLVKDGRIVQPWLGVRMVTNTPSIASRFDLPVQTGVLVYEVLPRTPAQQAGVRAGNVIQRIDDRNVATADALGALIASHGVGDQVQISGVERAGREFSVRVRLAQSPRTCG